MNYIQAMKLLESGNLSKIYVLSGNEIFLVDTFVEMFKQKIVNQEFFDMNYIEYDFSKIDLQKLKIDCETIPFFSNRRLVIIKNVNLTKSGISTYKSFFDEIYDYMDKIPNSTVLLLVMRGETAFRGKFYKEISILGHNIEADRLGDVDLFRFIKKRFTNREIEVKESIIKYIIDRIGYLDASREKNLYDVENELKKILESKNINNLSVDDVDEILVDKFENNIFKLLDCIGKMDNKGAISILRQLIKSGEDPFAIFYMIVRFIRNLLGIKYLKTKQKHIDYISKELKISTYECKKLYATCDNFSINKLCEFFDLAYYTDCSIKTKNTDINLLLEILIFKMSLGGNYE